MRVDYTQEQVRNIENGRDWLDIVETAYGESVVPVDPGSLWITNDNEECLVIIAEPMKNAIRELIREEIKRAKDLEDMF